MRVLKQLYLGTKILANQSKPEQFKAALIFWTVELIRVLTVATDSMFSSFEEVEQGVETNIWKATVSSEPPDDLPAFALVEAPFPVSGRPSPDITKPDGRTGIIDESSPFIAMFMVGMSMGAYTKSDPNGSVQLSWSITMLFSLGAKGCFTAMIQWNFISWPAQFMHIKAGEKNMELPEWLICSCLDERHWRFL